MQNAPLFKLILKCLMQPSRIPINLAKLELQKVEHAADLSRIYRISLGKTR